ncbi:RHS repeat domain-containing protein [Aquisalibacillus elongatus]|uniref:RHS repeat domain-containing protein n=1 Tax=Aquisalibacillus elongatus TaxID=485577 RepID=UPI000F524DC3|nr:RHS repeat-associated core domain-containing protein [Aquisalibacillus elongatus]
MLKLNYGFNEPKYYVEPSEHVEYTYDKVGNRLTETKDGEVTEYDYNANNQLTQAGNHTFEYDQNGNIVREAGPDQERDYTYDAANRLRAVMFGDESYVEYGYDALGRKATRESGMWRELGNPITDEHPDQGHGPGYSPGKGNGNGKGKGKGPNFEEHPGQGNAWGLKKRGKGKQKMEVVESRYFYEGQSHVTHKEYSPSGSPYAEYHTGPNNRVVSQKMFGYHGRSIPGQNPSMKTTGGLMYYHYDGMSSVSELTDRHGDIIERYRYDAFGGLMTGITAPYNTNNYTGHQYDQDTGLIDMQARTYDAKIGRFLQEDTYQGTLDTPLSQNRYAYVMNDPVNYWDPTGNVPEEVKAQDNFTKYVEVGTYQEQWRYEFQNHFTVNETSGNYQEHVGEKEIKLTWDVMTTVGWHYIASHEANLLEDGTLKLVDRRTEDHYWYEVTKESYEKITTAEDLMEQNYEALIRHGEVPEGSKQVFSGSMSFHNPQKKFSEIFNSGKKLVNEFLNMLPGVSSNTNLTVNNNELINQNEIGWEGTTGGFEHPELWKANQLINQEKLKYEVAKSIGNHELMEQAKENETNLRKQYSHLDGVLSEENPPQEIVSIDLDGGKEKYIRVNEEGKIYYEANPDYEWYEESHIQTKFEYNHGRLGRLASSYAGGVILARIVPNITILNINQHITGAASGLASEYINEDFVNNATSNIGLNYHFPEVGESKTMIYRTHRETGTTEQLIIDIDNGSVSNVTEWREY